MQMCGQGDGLQDGKRIWRPGFEFHPRSLFSCIPFFCESYEAGFNLNRNQYRRKNLNSKPVRLFYRRHTNVALPARLRVS